MLQAPDRFVAAAAMNPVCNLALMVGTTDIPDWVFVETYGSEGKSIFTEAPSAEHLTAFHIKSPIFHLSKVWILHASRLLHSVIELIWGAFEANHVNKKQSISNMYNQMQA